MTAKEQRDAIARTIGAEIAKRRKLQHISQKMLAEGLGMTTAQLCKIENGRNLPGIPVLKRIEEALGLNIGTLIEMRDAASSDTQQPRLVPIGEGLSATEEELNAVMADIVPQLDRYARLEDEIGMPHFCRIRLADFAAETERDGIELAECVRERLGIGNAPIADMPSLLEPFGIRILFLPNLPPVRDGRKSFVRATLAFHDTAYDTPVICVSDEASETTQRYHIAYELGACLRYRHALRRRKAPSDAEWVFARAFAATFLMPTTSLRDLIDTLRVGGSLTDTLVVRLAARYGVSPQAFLYRLASIGRIEKPIFSAILKRLNDWPPSPAAGRTPPGSGWLETLKARASFAN